MLVDPQANVLAVVTNWRRPWNVDRIIAALRMQTIRPTIVVVDNSGGAPHCRFDTQHIDDVWRFDVNHGPPCRWAPALMDCEHAYTLFLDDDLLPGSRAIEGCLGAAAYLQDQFSTLGVIGRRYGVVSDYYAQGCPRYFYRKRNVRFNGDVYCRVDLTCRTHFVRTQHLHCVLMRRACILGLAEPNLNEVQLRSLVTTHDDILLCQSLQMYHKLPSYLFAAPSAEWSLRATDLADGPETVSRRVTHVADRTQLIHLFHTLGWESLV